jgi:hypothetical protein
LEQRWKAYGVGVESGKSAKDDDTANEKVSVLERPEIDERIIVTRLTHNQTAQTKHEQHGQCLHAKKWISKPIPFLAFAEQDFPRSHRDGEQGKTERVEGPMLFASLNA